MAENFRFFDRRTISLIIFIAVLGSSMLFFGPHDTLDMRLYYTGDQARALLASFTPDQLHRYFINELCDLLFICSYTALFSNCLKKTFPKNRAAHFLAFVPGIFDCIETSFIIYATQTEGPQKFFDWLGVATFLKWALGTAAIISIIFGSLKTSRSQKVVP